ncbi:DUF1707 and DUF4190 domain-containing protein [Streptomyces sp. NPDC046924]|uniref:DUF1707 and DUF4190 domain-containing protein n=1 Tax=Streptomyces sp. NPDC046924 TaxID=3155136 RepID=UPI0034109D63
MSQSPYPSWQPWQGRGVPQPWGGPGGPQQGGPPMLASHADRERTVDVLRAGYAEGRLDQQELERRVARAYQARTVADLSLLVADLPQGPVPQTAAVQQSAAMQQHAAPMAPATFLPRQKTNEKAIGSMVCGVLCLATGGVTGIPAVVLGHMARAEIRRSGEQGDGLAVAGLVLGWLSTAGWAAFLLLLIMLGAASG